MATIEHLTSQEETVRKQQGLDKAKLSLSTPQAFEKLFKKYYEGLCQYCLQYVKQEEIAEEIVQDMFVKLWQLKNQLNVHTSLKAYLYTSVKNGALNYLKSQYARQQFEGHKTQQFELLIDSTTQESLDYEDLTKLVSEAVERLPQQCRTIFEMSRSGGYTYKEISEKLNIAPKTVENQMGIGLKKLKEYLRTYWDLLVIMLVMLSNTNGKF